MNENALAAPPEPALSEFDEERTDAALINFEYAAWHLASAFAKWRRDCMASLPFNGLNGSEASILHIIHMNGTAKGLSEISRLLHRDDTANLQYGIKKLLSQQYISKSEGSKSRKLTTYGTTEKGDALIEAYMQRRSDILLAMTHALPGIAETIERTTNFMHVMVGLYEQASDIATTRPAQAPATAD